LTWEERADIPLVTDRKNNILVRVRDVSSWVEACKDERLATMNRGRPRDVVKPRRHRGLPRRKSEELVVEELSSDMQDQPRDSRRKRGWEGAKQKRKIEDAEFDSASDTGHKQGQEGAKRKRKTEDAEFNSASDTGHKRKSPEDSSVTRRTKRPRRRIESEMDAVEEPPSSTKQGPPGGRGKIVARLSSHGKKQAMPPKPVKEKRKEKDNHRAKAVKIHVEGIQKGKGELSKKKRKFSGEAETQVAKKHRSGEQ